MCALQVVDARSEGRFSGTAPEPRPSLPSGHMTNSINLPFKNLLNPENKLLKSKQHLQEGIMCIACTYTGLSTMPLVEYFTNSTGVQGPWMLVPIYRSMYI